MERLVPPLRCVNTHNPSVIHYIQNSTGKRVNHYLTLCLFYVSEKKFCMKGRSWERYEGVLRNATYIYIAKLD